MQKNFLSLVGIFGATLLLGAGCNYTANTDTSSGGDSIVTQEENNMMENVEGEVVIDVYGQNFSFSPSEIKVKKGDKVTINFKSASGFHDFVIDEFVVATKQVQTGGESSVTFIADKAGTFEFYCSVGKHREMGMVGTLVVEENDVMMGETSLSGSADAMKNDTDLSGEINADLKLDLSDDMKEPAGAYEDYSESKLALADSGKVVLFFKASWCPTCNSLDKNVVANLSDIPAGVHILKVDYDNSTELKKKYGITYQHSFVQVDSKGKQIAKWAGSSTLSDLVKNIK